jgi:site-specific recombinase XerD
MFAREYLTAGGDLASLARLMGHSDPQVTATFYAVYAPDELAEKHDQFSPVRTLDKDS